MTAGLRSGRVMPRLTWFLVLTFVLLEMGPWSARSQAQYGPADADPGVGPQVPLEGEIEGQIGADPGALPQVGVDEEAMPDESVPQTRPRASRKSARRSRGPARKDSRGTTRRPASAADPKQAGSADRISFSRDVAPILVANCVGCHTGDGAGLRRSKLDFSSFESLMTGTPDHKVVVAGKPEESHLILRVSGEETPRMPQGGDRRLSDDAISQLREWVKAGARLDAGLDPKAAFSTYAATPEQLERLQISRLSASERDKKTEDVGRQRWKQANPKLSPELTPSDHFLLFSNLPKDRATATLKALEAQYAQFRRLVGPATTEPVEKVGVYVFNDRNDLVEFIRSVEMREVQFDVQSTGRLSITQPYVAAVDPWGGRPETATSNSRNRTRGRSRKADEAAEAGATPERSLGGLLTESLVSETLMADSKSPRWLALGLGSLMAERLEPRSPHYARLRAVALDAYRIGWATKANEALGNSPESRPDEVHGIGLAIVEWLVSTPLRQAFPQFLHGLSQGPEKLDDVLKTVYNADRAEFLTNSGAWVASRYGQLQ
jgi:hypothetical protein